MDRQGGWASPRLERFGTFRELTQQGTSSKTVIGDDLVPGVGLDCDPNPNSGAMACLNGRS